MRWESGWSQKVQQSFLKEVEESKKLKEAAAAVFQEYEQDVTKNVDAMERKYKDMMTNFINKKSARFSKSDPMNSEASWVAALRQQFTEADDEMSKLDAKISPKALSNAQKCNKADKKSILASAKAVDDVMKSKIADLNAARAKVWEVIKTSNYMMPALKFTPTTLRMTSSSMCTPSPLRSSPRRPLTCTFKHKKKRLYGCRN